MKRASSLTLLPLFALFACVSSCAVPSPSFDEEAWRIKVKSADASLVHAPHFNEGGFFNPWMPGENRGFFTFLRWRFSPGQEYTEEERSYLPRVIRKAKERILSMGDDDFIIWIGHATFLIRLKGEYWLTDPIFSERALLPKRKTPPGISLEELKEIAPHLNVILTHNHYDHLDKPSILGLPENAKMYFPLGLKDYLQSLNKKDLTELDWWQQKDCGKGITLVCLPAQHWSRRLGQGYNESLWASFLLITPEVKIYLGGDTGYFIGHREIGERFPGIDYALLPTTAYRPRWFMHYNHMNIDETIEAFNDLGARFMIPQQWGTFHLGDEPPGYSMVELKRKIAERGLDSGRFILLDIGEIHPIRVRTTS